MRYILNDKGEPILCPDLMEWGKWMEDGNRVLRQTKVGKLKISTVFLGLDHGFGLDGPGGEPVLWETMVFDTTTGHAVGTDGYDFQTRYSSQSDALEGHAKAVKLATPQIENK